MEISNEFKTQSPSRPAAPTSGETQQSAKIPDGTVVKGEITDLKPDQVTISTEDGQVVTAKLDTPVDAAIGQNRSFTARNSDGQLTLSINELPRETLHKTVISDALNSLGFKNTPENIKLAQIILENQLPMTKETLAKLNQAIKLMGPENLDKALFLMENDMRVNSRNAEALDGFISGQTKIQGQMKDMLANIEKLPAAEKNLLTEILLKGEAGIGDDKLIEKMLADIKSAGPSGATGQKIMAAFSNENLSMEAFAKLSEHLLKEFPENSEMIRELAGEKKAFMESVANTAAKPEVLAKLREAVLEGTLTPEALTRLAGETGSEPSHMLSRNEMRYIIDNLLSGESELKEKAAELLTLAESGGRSAAQEGSTPQKLLSRLSFALNSTDPKEIDAYLNNLRDNLDLAKSELGKMSLPDAQRILKDIDGINQNLEFVTQLKNNIFFQLPITVDGHETNSELFVFKDKRQQSQKKKGGSVSAMIALDTANLGRFETYVQKSDASVSCQFRLESEEIESLVQANLPKLVLMLRDNGYSLDNITFHGLNEPFSVMDKEPSGEPEVTIPMDGTSRIAFDIRT